MPFLSSQPVFSKSGCVKIPLRSFSATPLTPAESLTSTASCLFHYQYAQVSGLSSISICTIQDSLPAKQTLKKALRIPKPQVTDRTSEL